MDRRTFTARFTSSFTRRATVLALASLLPWALAAAPASAQEATWPGARPIRLLVGQPAGYSPDIVSRQLAEALAQELKQQIVVENRPGAGSALMMRALHNAAPDGYTLGSVFWNQMTVSPVLIKQVDYDPAEDFTHVGLWMQGAQILVAHPASGVGSVAELQARARTAPRPPLYGSMGVASPSHVYMALLLERAGLRMDHVPFAGQKAVLAVVSGDVPVAMVGVGDALPMIRSGQVRALAVTGTQRVPALPEVPTLTQAGVAGVEFAVWAGVLAPKGTPVEVVERLNQAIAKVVQRPEFKSRLEETGRQIQVSTPAQMQQRVRDEMPVWRALIQRLGLSVE